MRLLFGAAIALAGCRIPADHFIGPNDGDGGIDTNATDDSGVDAIPAVPLRNGYLIDTSNISRVNKSTTGTLTLATGSPTSVPNLQSGVVNKQGTHLLVVQVGTAAASQVLDYTINTGGSLATPPVMLTLGACQPRFSALHPSGNFIAVGCSNGYMAIVKLTNGAINTTAPATVLTGGTAPINPVFSPDGNCLYFADPGANQNHIQVFGFDMAGNVSIMAAVAGPVSAQGIAVHPTKPYLYVSGSGTTGVVAYSIGSSCALTAMGSRGCGPSSFQAAVSPNGDRLFVTGNEVYVFNIGTTGEITPVTGTPTLVGNPSMDGAIFDPAVPNILYITSVSSGTYPATIQTNGSMTMGATVSTGSTSYRWFAMAP